ncbi:MAG TPA: PHP domain-containing protein, partial [Vicinamibacterales bacterium]|nr:PHP domain-containing protein [Vicinamibacterales bacterium]
GPKTVAVLYRELGVRTIDDLEAAARSGRVRSLRGMGARKEVQILKALEERRQFAGRHLISESHEVAAALLAYLRERAPHAVVEPVGSLRRGCETCGDLDFLASLPPGASPSLMDDFTDYAPVERTLVRGETKSSVLLRGGFQADVRIVPPESRGAAMQYFTGSKAHNIALRDRAIGLGLKLNEYGVYRIADDVHVAGATEDEVYAALGLDYVPPEMREMRGEIELAEARAVPRLVELSDLRGDLHTHSTESDGKDDVGTMATAAREAGLDYIAVTDHSQSLAMANGLDERRALAHAERVRRLDAAGAGVRLLAGIECDIKADGSLDLSDDCLAALDLVIVSVHSAFDQDKARMTDRLLRAIENPHVDILGHPTGRRLLKRPPYAFDVDAVVTAAARRGVIVEINCQVERLDLNDVHARLARDRGAKLVISTDAHSRAAFPRLRWGVLMARRAWLGPEDIVNTLPFDRFRATLRRNAVAHA